MVIAVNSVNTLLEVVRSTAIATILPLAIAHRDRALHSIPLKGAPQRGAALLRRKNNYHSAASLAFMELIQGFSL
ncbi:HTH-type transcriptional regulator CynR [compost metagenome]